MIADICATAGGYGCGPIREPDPQELPADALVQLFPGGDLPEMPPDALSKTKNKGNQHLGK